MINIEEPHEKEKTFEIATEFISSFEGFRSCPYSDAGGYSIGYGTYAEENSQCISKEEGKKRLRYSINGVYKRVLKIEEYKHLNDNQIASILSFGYNTPRDMPVLNNKACINSFSEENREGIEKCLYSYTLKGSKYERGLRKRRNAEIELFFNI